MTLLVGVATGNGLVVASDSRTSFETPAGHRVLSDFTPKLALLGPYSVATTGWAFLSRKNIAAHLANFVSGAAGPPKPVAEIAQDVQDFFAQRMTEHTAMTGEAPDPGEDALTFLVAGYDGAVGRIFEVGIPSNLVTEVANTEEMCGYVVRGMSDVFDRLMKGVDFPRLNIAAVQAGKAGAVGTLAGELANLEYVCQIAFWNLQDAIDFAVLAIKTTMDVQRLTNGTHGMPGGRPGVGGPIEIVIIDPRKAEFLQQTKLQGERPTGQAEAGVGLPIP